jgi:chromosome segregation ATPase
MAMVKKMLPVKLSDAEGAEEEVPVAPAEPLLAEGQVPDEEAPMPRLEKWIENYEKTPNAEFSLTVSETGDMLAAARADLADEVKSRDKRIAQLESDLAGTQDVVRRNSQEAHDVVSRLRMQLDDAGQQLKAHADASAEMRQQYERAAKDAKELAELRARARQHREVILIAFKDWPRFRALLHICQSEKKGSE